MKTRRQENYRKKTENLTATSKKGEEKLTDKVKRGTKGKKRKNQKMKLKETTGKIGSNRQR